MQRWEYKTEVLTSMVGRDKLRIRDCRPATARRFGVVRASHMYATGRRFSWPDWSRRNDGQPWRRRDTRLADCQHCSLR